MRDYIGKVSDVLRLIIPIIKGVKNKLVLD